ncbi:MAG TPA: hypothetical protein VF746_15760 [Longimicrobium sp.]|jgi:hypothetical protein
MSGIARKVRGGLLAAGVLGALGFGAAEAFARPAEDEGPPDCNPTSCNAMCQGRFGPFASGECIDNMCLCAI